MPTYEYTCKKHGLFKAMAPLADFEKPQDCPECGKAAPRNLLSSPLVSSHGNTSPKARQTGHKGRKVKHAAGCPCCS